MAFLPTTRIYVTDHAIERYAERLGQAIGRMELARKVRGSSPASKGVRSRFKQPALPSQSRLVYADKEAVYLLAANHHVAGAFWLVTVLNRTEVLASK